ncbi:hypothetical protein ECP030477710_4820 [Escherichia coli P0304777.10]|nr:hypothetical protein EC180600_4879 [Escherichia coli 180600]EMZ90274.1 hypothetical protein EC1999001_4843 [Escherichia coli 199900.1]ENE56639.1 hypothetical protein ECP030477710_4820 [Escherichia coli P0304777.10]ENE56684.1 hypothetical protein ECP030477712_5202 [Escherichia coli P0304777.12]ENE58644.1 hypothetical protein ECP030477713_5036 [Escherichia coli P0304777.13]ENE61904.1 hypothetical protein ECP030477711_5033 [Escherichia coli P0304777.11]ENE79995.1 hypothetical protein ECP03047
MNKKIYILFALTAGLFISVHASENGKRQRSTVLTLIYW